MLGFSQKVSFSEQLFSDTDQALFLSLLKLSLTNLNELARAFGVPDGRRSGGQLATMLVATKNDILFFSHRLLFS